MLLSWGPWVLLLKFVSAAFPWFAAMTPDGSVSARKLRRCGRIPRGDQAEKWHWRPSLEWLAEATG